MGIGRQKGIDVVSGLWAGRPFWATKVFLKPDKFGSGHVALPSFEIVKDDCKNGFIYADFLDDGCRRGYGGHVVNTREMLEGRRTYQSRATGCVPRVSQGEGG